MLLNERMQFRDQPRWVAARLSHGTVAQQRRLSAQALAQQCGPAARNRDEHRFGVVQAGLDEAGQAGQVVALVVIEIGQVVQAVLARGLAVCRTARRVLDVHHGSRGPKRHHARLRTSRVSVRVQTGVGSQATPTSTTASSPCTSGRLSMRCFPHVRRSCNRLSPAGQE